MGKLKPFVFGCCVGAAVIFVGLQYHLIRSHDGFQFVPRTPQHSVGLAFVDVRDWDAAHWADRPELARALVAHGSSDLIAASVAENLADTITSGNSTLDQLRSFINDAPPKTNSADDFMRDPLFLPQSRQAAPNDNTDLFQVPFPDTTHRIKPLQQLTESIDRAPATNIARNNKLSVEDVFGSGAGGLRQNLKPEISTAGDGAATPSGMQRIREETRAFEEMLFGEEIPAATLPAGATPVDVSGSIFQDVTAALDRRAADALARARSGFNNEVDMTLNESVEAAGGYVRNRARETLPDSTATTFTETSAASQIETFTRTPSPAAAEEIPYALKALQEGFDPFLSR